MPLSLSDVCCARIPLTQLGLMAAARCLPGLEVRAKEDDLWLLWQAGDEAMLRLVLPLPGVMLLEGRAGHWYRPGCLLPTAGPPDVPSQRLDQFIAPEPVKAVVVGTIEASRCRVRLVRDEQPRPATGMETELAALAEWAESATTAQLAALRAARSGSRVLLLGERLPLLPGTIRFWGQRVLVPLGHRPDPALPESVLCESLKMQDEDIALISQEGAEVLPAEAFQPLSRAGVRLAIRERAP